MPYSVDLKLKAIEYIKNRGKISSAKAVEVTKTHWKSNPPFHLCCVGMLWGSSLLSE